MRNPLVEKLFADGCRLTPSHSSKQGRRYRYYVSHAGESGRPAAAERWRLNADALEATILKSIDDWLASPQAASMLLKEGARASDVRAAQEKLDALRKAESELTAPERLRRWAARVDRIEIEEPRLTLGFSPSRLLPDAHRLPLADECTVRSEVAFGRRGHGLRLVVGETSAVQDPDSTALALIKRAIVWRDRWFADPSATLASIAKADQADSGDVSRHLRLAFLAPDIVSALLDGTAPDELDAERLRRLPELPASWADQRRLFGLVRA